ncbi:MAG: iron-sulfur cluster assembly protein [Myxococcota bacterium]|jgi:iron-sulfur cluster assembly protein
MSLVKMTPLAVQNVRRLQQEYDAHEFGLRFGLTGGGCSGYKYVLELESEPDADDHVFEFDGVKVFLKEEHTEQLKNSVIDWTESLMESGFNIENPQAQRSCGCGESFDLAGAKKT